MHFIWLCENIDYTDLSDCSFLIFKKKKNLAVQGLPICWGMLLAVRVINQAAIVVFTYLYLLLMYSELKSSSSYSCWKKIVIFRVHSITKIYIQRIFCCLIKNHVQLISFFMTELQMFFKRFIYFCGLKSLMVIK